MTAMENNSESPRQPCRLHYMVGWQEDCERCIHADIHSRRIKNKPQPKEPPIKE